MLELPWPPAKLSPNARGNWRTKEKARTEYKFQCFMLAKGTEPRTSLSIVFHPPDNRHRDLDNMLASCKYGIDGIAQAWNVNDKQFRPITIDIGPPVKHGKVVIA